MAIAYLLRQPRAELLGITTVTGDVNKRAAIAEVLCRTVGRDDIPIVAGRSDALAHGPGQPWTAQYEAIAHLPHRLDRTPNSAVEFMRETIRARPGEITLLTIGPLGNIALLFALDPEIPFLLKDIVSMAGAFFGHENHEWNCKCDPAACGIVTASKRPSHTWFGLDVTLQCALPAEEIRSQFTGDLLECVASMAEHWFSHTPHLVFHDPLAAAAIFEPDLCDYAKGRVISTPEDAHTYFESGPGNDRVAATVKSREFFDHFFSVMREE